MAAVQGLGPGFGLERAPDPPMSLKQIGILTPQLLASSMLENGLAIPRTLRAEIGDKPGPNKRRRTAERPSQQEIEAGCDAVARQCQRPPPPAPGPGAGPTSQS